MYIDKYSLVLYKKPKETSMAEKTQMRRITVSRTIQQVKKSCSQCGREFWASPIQQYCSPNCRVNANYARHAERYRKARMAKYYGEKK
jgi:hypothetical protein